MADLLGPASVVSFIWQGVAWLLLSWVAYNAIKIVYNLYFHPLAKYPGPSFAAASDWWQAYIEVFMAKSLSKELWNLHQQYGACITEIQRTVGFLGLMCALQGISSELPQIQYARPRCLIPQVDLPNHVQLHFSKPSVYEEIYNIKNRWDRDMKLYHIFADEQSTITIPDYPSAKKRRDIIMPLFSRKNIVEMQYLVQQCVWMIPFRIPSALLMHGRLIAE